MSNINVNEIPVCVLEFVSRDGGFPSKMLQFLNDLLRQESKFIVYHNLY